MRPSENTPSTMSIKTRAALVIAIGTVLGVSLSVGGNYLADRRLEAAKPTPNQQAELLAEVMERVKQDYVDPIDDAELLEKAIRGMVGDLDPHSAFLDASEYQDIRVMASGRYSGVGLEISAADDRIMVIAPIDGTPAQRAGILAGDEIIEINDTRAGDERLIDTISKLRGREGTSVTLRVRREDYDDPLSFTLTRQDIQVQSARHQLLDDGVGYLRISQFTDTTADETSVAIDALMDVAKESTGQMLTGLVLDLRNNPGGILDAAVDVSDLFLDDGVIVEAVGRTEESRFTRDARRGDILDGAAMVVLVNGGSASASEIVAGALQDHDRATIIGTQTFGKGLVQTVMPLSRGRAIKLTTSHYYTPSGDSINDKGVTPDQVVEGDLEFPGRSLSNSVEIDADTQLVSALQALREQSVLHYSRAGGE